MLLNFVGKNIELTESLKEIGEKLKSIYLKLEDA